jgi:uncharacterized protein (TIGR00266 family)
MEFTIEKSPVFSTLVVKMNPGEQFKAEAGAMVAKSSHIDLQAQTTGGGFFGSIKAMFGGESLFSSVYTCQGSPGELILAPANIGDIIRVDLKGETIFSEGGAYLAGDIGLELSTQGSFKALISGEGLFLQKISGTGTVFLSTHGAVMERTLKPGETFVVDTGHIVAFDSSVQYTIRKAAKGWFSTGASGEWLVAEYTGPGRIWLQTRNLGAFANIIRGFLPDKSSN